MLTVLFLVITSLLSLTEAQNKPISKNARCGSANRGQTCQGSSFGNCCSNYGYCGSTSDYCAPKNCQKDFGSCNGGQASSVRGTTLSSIIIPANPSTASAVRETMTVTSTLTPSVQSIVTVTLTPSVVPAVTVTLTPSAAQTVTVVGSPSLLPASTVTIVGSQSLLPASTITVLETPSPLPASTTTVFGSPSLLPASTIVQTITETPSPLEASTVTVIESASPLAASTITVVETPSPLAASTVTVIETPSPLAASTVTVIESASPLSASTITETATISATPLPAVITTSTVTASASAACPNPTGNAVVNGDFESVLTGNWFSFPAGDSIVERTSSSAAPGGTFAYRVRVGAPNPNLPQRVVQALNLCPGNGYRVSFQARRATTVGTISAVAYLGQYALAGGVITSETFASAQSLGFIVVTNSTMLLTIEFTFSGGIGAAKEVLIDSVVVTQT